MVEPSQKFQMVLGGAGGLGLAVGQGLGRSLGGDVGAWLGLGIGFAVGGVLAWFIIRTRNPNPVSETFPAGLVGAGLLFGIVPAAVCYFGGQTGGVIAFWSMVALPIVIGLGMLVARKSRKEVSGQESDFA